jgi:UDP-N-acetylmuramoyl-L-alanyl-D-glutamate--2,6-diaminopimelate ligase
MFETLKRMPGVRHVHNVPWIMQPYHFILSLLAAWWYRFPSARMTIIGVTGTKGKTTTCNLIAQILEYAGRKTGLATTVNFRIDTKEWINDTKQTMLGRFSLQALLKEMADAGCRYGVIETSSEGIAQYRHRFIDYDIVVFTNISPEHIERHGSFEQYRASKVKLFSRAAQKKGTIGVFNMDDPNVEYFLEPPIEKKIGYSLTKKQDLALMKRYGISEWYEVSGAELAIGKTKFVMNKERFETTLIGEFNVYNAASAIAACSAIGVPLRRVQSALAASRAVPGRFEIVSAGQPFAVVVDYAHEPASLEAAYNAVQLFKPKHVIGLLGAQGGGRDTWKREAMGKIAARHCDQIVLTNEDPYDEDPMAIIADIKKGIYDHSKDFKPVYKIPDRREAIRKALLLAKKGDAVILTGKGGETWMCVENGRKIAWNERAVVEELINEEADSILTRSGRNLRFETEEDPDHS